MLRLKDARKVQALGTPLWYYDMDLFRATVAEAARAAGKHGVIIHYSIKANSEPRLLEELRKAGLGIDCVSGNEVRYSIEHGFDPSCITFAGVGKTDAELMYAMRVGVGSFNCESVPELEVIAQMASENNLRANVSLRINPDVDAHTHRFISTGHEFDKFGIAKRDVGKVLGILRENPQLDFKGLHFHVGSQILDVADVFRDECRSANEIISFVEASGFPVGNIDLGGGLGIDYENPDAHPIPDFELWFSTIREHLKVRPEQRLHVEPGRSIAGQCCSLLSRAIYVKEGETKTYVILDSGMNDLIRPALYGAYHLVENLTSTAAETAVYDIAGPICESSDVIATGRELPLTRRGDILAIRSAGAYGAAMSSHYNMRTPAAAVFSDDL